MERGGGPGAYVLAGGGTGGHVFPAVAIAREIRRRRPGVEVVFIGTLRGLEAVVAPREGFPIEFVSASGFVGTGWKSKVSSIRSLLVGVFQARALLRRHRARGVLGVGGYASLPVVLAARLSGIPTMIQEQNSVPGLANRIAGRFAASAAVGFESAARSFGRKSVWTGNPVRPEFFEISPLAARPLSRRVFLFGGSQGSRVLNAALRGSARALGQASVRIVAQTGEREFEALHRDLAALPGVTVAPFFPEIWKEIEAADLVVCRSGALTVAELCAAGRPAILVPFAAATPGHQEANARQMEVAGAALRLTEEQASERLASEIVGLLSQPDRLLTMGTAAHSLARPDAARRIADLFFSISGEAS